MQYSYIGTSLIVVKFDYASSLLLLHIEQPYMVTTIAITFIICEVPIQAQRLSSVVDVSSY